MRITLIVILLSIKCAVAFAQSDTVPAVHYKTLQFDCAIFPANNTSYSWQKNRFTPTKEEVNKAEHALRVQLAALNAKHFCQNGDSPIIDRKLRRYARQYFGYIDSLGHKVLFINCFYKNSDNLDELKNFFLKSFIRVSDGCSYFWQVYYDTNTDKLFSLYVHGQG